MIRISTAKRRVENEFNVNETDLDSCRLMKQIKELKLKIGDDYRNEWAKRLAAFKRNLFVDEKRGWQQWEPPVEMGWTV